MVRVQKTFIRLAVMLLLLSAFAAPSSAQYLSYHGGRIAKHPRLHVMYWHHDWDSVHSDPQFKRDYIDAWLTAWAKSNYFDKASQYDVHTGSFSESNGSSYLTAYLGLDPFPDTNSLNIHLWWTAEVTTPGTGVPYPCDDNDIYVILLPKGAAIDNIFNRTCDSFGAYHLFGPVLVPPAVCGFDLGGISLAPYCVIPVDCATKSDASGFYTDFDALTMLLSHEIIEAATDPLCTFVTSVPVIGDIFGVFLGVFGDLPGYYDGTVDDLFRKSEAADIPEFAPFSPQVWHNDALVAAYWSNADGAPAAGSGRVRDFRLGQTGVPPAIPVRVALDTRTADVGSTSFKIQVAENSEHSYAFPSPVDGGPGTQYVTNEPPATVTITGDFSKYAVYSTQYLLTVSTNPAAAAVGNATLTQSGFYAKGSVTLHTDQDVAAGTGSRYDFRDWSGDISGATPDYTFILAGPASAVADYQLQHLVTVNTSGLGANATHLFVNGTLLGTATDASPFTGWVADGVFGLSADDLVNGTGGIAYFFQGFTPTPPTSLSAPFTTTANYENMDQVIGDLIGSGGIYGPGADAIAHSLRQKWALVTAKLAAGQYAAALNLVKAFINEVQAQTGKHITPAASRSLQLSALLVFHSALCSAKSAGQLPPSQVTAEYGYYNNAVMVLGGTPKPACP